MALNYCRLGASDAQLCEFFGISPTTLGAWLANDRDFADAVRSGRKLADFDMVDSLHRLGVGWVETVEKVMMCRGAPMVVTYNKQHPPHFKAGVMWLCNRMPEHWSWLGTRRRTDAVAAQAVDLFALPLLVDESAEGDAEDEAVAAVVGSAPRRGAQAVSMRREEAPRRGAPPARMPSVAPRPPPRRLLAAA